MAKKSITIGAGAEIIFSKKGSIMFKDGDVIIRTNVSSIPETVKTISYDDTQIVDYNGGKYANGTFSLGLNSLYTDKLAALKESGITLSM